MTEGRKSQEADERVEDLDVTAEDAHEVKGGGGKKKKPTGDDQGYYQVKLSDILIS